MNGYILLSESKGVMLVEADSVVKGRDRFVFQSPAGPAVVPFRDVSFWLDCGSVESARTMYQALQVAVR